MVAMAPLSKLLIIIGVLCILTVQVPKAVRNHPSSVFESTRSLLRQTKTVWAEGKGIGVGADVGKVLTHHGKLQHHRAQGAYVQCYISE